MYRLSNIQQNPPKNGKFYIIAIDGRGGAGKTTLLKYIAKLLPNFIMLNGDDYFEPDDTTIAWGSFNDERFSKDVIAPLRNGEMTLNYRPYNWHAKPHISEKKITITKGICIERSFSFSFDVDWDLKIWVETPSDIALERGQVRDEMPLEEGLKIWTEVWKPKEDIHIKKINPLKTADIVIDGTKPFESQLA
jgi:uridine kinase